MEKVTIDVDVPQPVIQNLKTVTITSNTTTSITPDEGYDGIRAVSVTTNVPSNNETWTNKRLQTNNTYTISNLMNDNTKDGVSKESTIVVDVPQLDVTQISNYLITSNGTQSVPIPSGYDAVDYISLNVAVNSKIEFDGFRAGNSSGIKSFSEFTKIDSNISIDVANGFLFIYIVDDYQASSPRYDVYLYYNRTGSTVSQSLTYNSSKNIYYLKLLSSTNVITFDSNGNDILQLRDYYQNNDNDITQMRFYKSYVEIVGFPS